MKLLFSLLFSLATVTGFFLDRGLDFESMSILSFVAYLAVTAVLTVAVWFVAGFLLRRMPAAGRRMMLAELLPGGKQSRQWFGFTGLLMLCWLPVWLAHWPGFWNYDVSATGDMLLGKFSTHHPLIHTLFTGFCYAFGRMFSNANLGVALFTFLQMLLMAIIFADAVCVIRRVVRQKWIWIATLLFYGVFPVNSILVPGPTKDIIFTGLITLLMSRLLHLYLDGTDICDAGRQTVWLTGICVLMLLNRNNAVIAFLILLGYLLLFRKRVAPKKQLLRLMGLIVVLWLFFSQTLKLSLQAESGSDAEMFSVFAQQYGRIHEYGEEADREIVENYFNYERAQYVPALSDSMKFHFKPYGRAAFLKQSARWAFRYPLLTLDSFLYLTKGHWDIGDRSFAEMYRMIYPNAETGCLSMEIYGGYGVSRNSLLPALEEAYRDLFVNNHIFDIPVVRVLFVPAFWHWLFAFCSLAWFRYAPRRVSVWLVFLWGLLFTMFLGPCALLRYSYPFLTCAPLLLVFALVFAGRYAGEPGEERKDSGVDGA